MERKIVSGKPELLRRINRTLIMDLLRREGPLSRSDIAQRSGVSLPAISRAVAELIADGWVSELGAGTSSGGRRPILLQFNPRAGFVVGVDVTPYRLLGGAADLSGELVAEMEEVPAALGYPLLEQVGALIGRLIDAMGGARGPLSGVGVAVPGIPDGEGQTVSWIPALDWDGVPAGRVLQERFGCPVAVYNDVDALLLGELWKGAAASHRHAVAVTVLSGIGSAVLLDGHLYRGRNGAVGEIGYWLTEPPSAPLQPPQLRDYGPLESRVALTMLARRWAAETGFTGSDPLDGLIAAALAGESRARELTLETARWMGVAITNLVTLLNPEVVILGGTVLKLESLVLPVIRQMVQSCSPYPAPVVPAQLGRHSALIGTVYGVLQRQRSSISFVQ